MHAALICFASYLVTKLAIKLANLLAYLILYIRQALQCVIQLPKLEMHHRPALACIKHGPSTFNSYIIHIISCRIEMEASRGEHLHIYKI
jgi:hypothetical protein